MPTEPTCVKPANIPPLTSASLSLSLVLSIPIGSSGIESISLPTSRPVKKSSNARLMTSVLN
nr:MAG TPA: hypothetical protein [Caudoviricetes sp.]